MRLALVLALTPDRRSGRVMSEILPADQAISQVKQAINANACPDARFPLLQAVAVDTILREHGFNVTAADIKAAEKAAASRSAVEMTLEATHPILVEIGEGDEKVILNLATEEEAKFVRGLADFAKAAVTNRIFIQDGERALTLVTKEDAEHVRMMIAAREEFVKVRENEQKLAARVVELERLVNAEARKAAKELRQKATQLNQAAVDAASAADAAKGKAGHAKLVKTAEDALETAKRAEAAADEAEAKLKTE